MSNQSGQPNHAWMTWEYFLNKRSKEFRNNDLRYYDSDFDKANLLSLHRDFILRLAGECGIPRIGTTSIMHYIGDTPEEPVVFMKAPHDYVEYSFHIKTTKVHRLQDIRFFCIRSTVNFMQDRVNEYCEKNGWEKFIE